MLAGAAAVFVTVLYLLKLRKRRIEVPFSPLWGRVLADRKSHADWWRRLKRLLSWLLHLILVGLLGLAMAGPHFKDEILQGRHILVLIDNSASMGAIDVSGGVDRLDMARRQAIEILEAVGGEDRVMIAAFNNRIEPLSPFVSEVSLLEGPLRELKVAATGTSYEQALGFAADSLRGKGQAELVIISDGAGLAGKSFDVIDFGPETTVRHLKIGERSDNVAITAFNARRYLANKLDFEIFVQAQSFFERTIEAELQIHADGRLVDTKALTLQPGEVYSQFYPSQAVSGEEIEARIRVTSRDARDVFPLDDRAFALLPSKKKLQVQLVTDGNLFLEGTLLLNPNIDVNRVRLSEYDVDAVYDITIFDRVTPPISDRGNFVYFAPEGELSPFELQGTVTNPIITDIKKSHPLMRWITLTDVNIGQSAKLRRAGRDEVVASSFGTPIIMTRSEEGRQMVVVGFDVRHSDFPLRVAFPVFIFNLLDYFALADQDFIQSYATGETWAVAVARGLTTAKMHPPQGPPVEIPVFDGRAMYYGEAPGFYRLETPQSSVRIAANLSDVEESRIAPNDIELPEIEITRQADSMVFERYQIWIWILLLATLLLLIEWWTYNRRVTV